MGKKIPKAEKNNVGRINPLNIKKTTDEERIVFSFSAIEKTEYFNLDGTCQNWSADLFDTMKIVSNIAIKDVYAGVYSREGSPLRIHTHENAKPPFKIDPKISLKDMWQIRISQSKGGVHGVFYENTFFVIWFDPLHNLYPSEIHGGLRKVKPASTCCKDRDQQVIDLKLELEKVKSEADFWEEYAKEKESILTALKNDL